MGIVDKIQDKLSSNKHSEHDQTHGTTTTTGTHVGQEPIGAHSGTHSGAALTGNPTNASSGLTGDHHSHGSDVTGGTAVGGEHFSSQPGNTQHADLVPGSHPSAQNPAAVPTAGGARVGSIPGGNGPYDDGHGTHGTHDNRSGMEKIKDKVVPSRTDRPDDPITGHNYGQNTTSGVSTHHNQPGLTGSHNTSAATPLAHDSSFNDRHTGPGLTGNAHSGPGIATNTHSGPGLTGSTQSQGTHLSGHDQYAAGGIDNRSGMEKIKDKVIPSRSDRPDDPLTGQNYGQTSGTGNYTTGAHTGSHVPGTAHLGQGSHIAGSQPHGTGVGGVGHTGAYNSTPGTGFGDHSTTHGTPQTTHVTTTAAKSSLMDKLNPKKDADRDGKAGIMD